MSRLPAFQSTARSTHSALLTPAFAPPLARPASARLCRRLISPPLLAAPGFSRCSPPLPGRYFARAGLMPGSRPVRPAYSTQPAPGFQADSTVYSGSFQFPPPMLRLIARPGRSGHITVSISTFINLFRNIPRSAPAFPTTSSGAPALQSGSSSPFRPPASGSPLFTSGFNRFRHRLQSVSSAVPFVPGFRQRLPRVPDAALRTFPGVHVLHCRIPAGTTAVCIDCVWINARRSHRRLARLLPPGNRRLWR